MAKWLAVIGACLALGLVVAGCGDDEGDDGGSNGGAAQQEQTGGSDAGGADGGGAAAKTAAVSMKEIAFNPEAVTVATGGTVTWTNDESVGHDVTKKGGPGKDFSSGEPGAMQSGDTFEQTFATAGRIEYVCTVHPGMEGSVTVK